MSRRKMLAKPSQRKEGHLFCRGKVPRGKGKPKTFEEKSVERKRENPGQIVSFKRRTAATNEKTKRKEGGASLGEGSDREGRNEGLLKKVGNAVI